MAAPGVCRAAQGGALMEKLSSTRMEDPQLSQPGKGSEVGDGETREETPHGGATIGPVQQSVGRGVCLCARSLARLESNRV